MRIREIIPTNHDRFSVLIGDIISSNKSNGYNLVFHNDMGYKYQYCMIKNQKGFIVFHCMQPVRDPEMMPNDSLIVNTNQNKYWLFRKGHLKESYPITIGSSGNFSNQLTYDISNSSYWNK